MKRSRPFLFLLGLACIAALAFIAPLPGEPSHVSLALYGITAAFAVAAFADPVPAARWAWERLRSLVQLNPLRSRESDRLRPSSRTARMTWFERIRLHRWRMCPST